MISCNTQDCRVGPNVTMQQKDPVKTNSDIPNKNESKSISDQIHDFRDAMQPGAQLRCKF